MRITDNKEKRGIIEQLLEDKKINFDEAMLLLEVEIPAPVNRLDNPSDWRSPPIDLTPSTPVRNTAQQRPGIPDWYAPTRHWPGGTITTSGVAFDGYNQDVNTLDSVALNRLMSRKEVISNYGDHGYPVSNYTVRNQVPMEESNIRSENP